MGPSAISSQASGISLFIPTLNGGARFVELLEALGSQEIEGGFELLVIDSGSNDGTPERAEQAGARVMRIPSVEFNHGRTRNLGIENTRGSIIALLTQDAVPMDADYLANLVRPLQRAESGDGPNVDGAYARQFPRPDCDPILAERLRQWSASRDEPLLQVLSPGDAQASRELFEGLPPFERYMSCAFDNVASALRRSSWERTPYPEASFGEDVAWARATLLAGGAVAFEPSARVEHSHRISMRREFKRLYCDHRNLNELFGLRNVPSWAAVRGGWRGQAAVYRRLLDGQSMGRLERWYWTLYAYPYAFQEGLAQFLGARSLWKGEKSAFWRWIDARVRKGV